MGRIIPYIMENKKCSKPPTRYSYIIQSPIHWASTPPNQEPDQPWVEHPAWLAYLAWVSGKMGVRFFPWMFQAKQKICWSYVAFPPLIIVVESTDIPVYPHLMLNSRDIPMNTTLQKSRDTMFDPISERTARIWSYFMRFQRIFWTIPWPEKSCSSGTSYVSNIPRLLQRSLKIHV
jgi:hypothetical protein